ncbi:uncharacterized protein LOC131892181 [Tigriopus californicus]|uniref:uncharacterized protein LOC131892181 n=1 Tax=Tigriopus californicus TaxID=6832 RepID=UPI0027DA1CCC|nr:uncharacterized protein LOC131892181 [Tigriopus californicus]
MDLGPSTPIASTSKGVRVKSGRKSEATPPKRSSRLAAKGDQRIGLNEPSIPDVPKRTKRRRTHPISLPTVPTSDEDDEDDADDNDDEADESPNEDEFDRPRTLHPPRPRNLGHKAIPSGPLPIPVIDEDESSNYDDSDLEWLTDESDVELPRGEKSKKKTRPPPTGFWIGRGKAPTTMGKIAGSHEKFHERKLEAQCKVRNVELRCKGTIAIARFASSHTLMGFQWREARRLWRFLDGHVGKEGHSISQQLGAVLQIGVSAARHEVAMAEVFEEHGLEVMEGVEGHTSSDPLYADRTEYVFRQIKKAKVEDALLRGKVSAIPPLQKVSPGHFSLPSTRRRPFHRGTRGGQYRQSPPKPPVGAGATPARHLISIQGIVQRNEPPNKGRT